MNELILIITGTIVGAISVVVGGGFFWSIPIWQLLFPEVSMGVLIGNLKVGSVFRGLGSTVVNRDQFDWKETIWLAWPMLIGTTIGVSVIAQLDQRWTIVGLVTAVLVTEYAEWLSKRVTQTHFIIGSLLMGLYAGFLGAGVGVIIVALLRLKHPADEKIARVKSQGRVLELFMGIIAVVAHFLHGNLVSSMWIWWSIGSVLGGVLGGKALLMLDKMDKKVQKFILRTAYVLSIGIAIWHVTAFD